MSGHGRHEAGRARHAARAGRADHARRGRPAVVPRARLRERRARDRRAGHRPRHADRQGAAEDRGHRQEHRRQDPRAARDRQGGEARGAARRSTRASVVALLRIQGLGPEGGARGCAPSSASQSIDDLRAALAEHKLRELEGLRREVRGEARRRRWRGSTRRAPSTARRSRWRCRWRRASSRALREVPGVTHASYCGSLRRFSETIGDVDIVVAAARRRAGDGGAGRDDLRRPRAGARRGQDQRRHPPRHAGRRARRRRRTSSAPRCSTSPARRATTSSCASARWPAACTLNEYALSEIEGGKVVASETEEQIYAALGLPFIPPVLREDAGEIEAAESGTLPRPIGAGDRRLPRAHHGVGRRALVARGGGRGGQRARLPRAGDHRPRRGDAAPASAARRCSSSAREIRALQAELGDVARACCTGSS